MGYSGEDVDSRHGSAGPGLNSRRKAGRPRTAKERREVYSVRLPPSLAKRAEERAGGLTKAIELALTEWLRMP